jgi:hypothetical protein
MVEEFLNISKREFAFLIDKFGFRLKSSRKEPGQIYIVRYINSTTAVLTSWELRDNWINVEFYELTNGKLIEDPLRSDRGESIKSCYLELLLMIRAPQIHIKNTPSNMTEVETCLKEYSNAAETFFPDILKGDFSIFAEAEKIIQKRRDEIRKSTDSH